MGISESSLIGVVGSSRSSRVEPFPWVTRFSSRSAHGRRMMGSGGQGVSICPATFGASLPSGSGLSARSPRPSSPREPRGIRPRQAETLTPLIMRRPTAPQPGLAERPSLTLLQSNRRHGIVSPLKGRAGNRPRDTKRGAIALRSDAPSVLSRAVTSMGNVTTASCIRIASIGTPACATIVACCRRCGSQGESEYPSSVKYAKSLS